MNKKSNMMRTTFVLIVLAVFLYGCSNGVITGKVVYDKTASSELKAAEANETPAAANSSQNEVQETIKNQTTAVQNQTKPTYNILAGSSGSKKTSSSSGGGSSTPSSNIPDAAEFSGDTTDFSNENDLTAVNDLVLEVPSSGKIDFSGQSVDVSNADLDAYVQISNNLISVDSNNLPELNKPATLTFYGLSFSNPVILQDGSRCTDCNIVSYTNGDLTFTVQHFTNYTSQESGKPCAHVVDDLVVNVSAVLCAGTYPADDVNGDGIFKIGANNVVLDCNGTTIIGNDPVGYGRTTFDSSLKAFGYGIYSSGYSNITIKNCIIKNYWKGIYLNNSNNNHLLSNSVINNTIIGIDVVASSGNTVQGNVIKLNNRKGVNLAPSDITSDSTSCKNNVIKNNIVENNGYGISLENGNDNNNITGNTIRNNPNAGIQITGNNKNNAKNNYIVGNNLTGNGGFDVTESKRGLYSGIYVGSAGTNYILNNNVLNNLGPGIALFNSSNNEIKNNNVKNNAFEGVLLMNDITPSRGLGNKNNIILGNEITGNGRVAVVLGINSAGNSVTENNLANSVIGNHFGMFKTDNLNYVFADNTFNGKDVVTVNGTIFETNGSLLAGVNISYYYSTVWDAESMAGNYSLLIPKSVPDTVTNINGYYEAYLPEGEYDMVMQHSKEIDFDINTNKTSKEKGGGKGHDAEIDLNSSKYTNYTDPISGNYTDFNVEGHIIHSGRFEHGNNYTCNEYVDFTMFGINKGGQDISVTFVVENHTDGGKPERAPFPCNESTIEGTGIVYCGNQSNPSENLILPNNGDKYNKTYQFYIPCSWTGKYDIHVYDNLKWGQMHKIGNFFVVGDTTPPDLNAWIEMSTIYPNKGFTNDSFYIGYSSKDPNQTGTLAAIVTIAGRPDKNINITVDKDINFDSDGDGTTDNDNNYGGIGGTGVTLPGVSGWEDENATEVIYNKSGHYILNVTATDASGNSVSKLLNVSVYITEEEADAIATPIYEEFGSIVLNLTLQHNINCELDELVSSYGQIMCDRWSDALLIGDEYLTDLNTDKNSNYIYNILSNSSKIDEPYVNGLSENTYLNSSGAANETNTFISECRGGFSDFIKVIYPSTAEEYNITLRNFLTHAENICGKPLS